MEGSVAVVTGGASGIGLATVERLVMEGARVVFCDLDPAAGKTLRNELGAAGRLHHSRRVEGGPNDGNAVAARLGDSAVFVGADITDRSQLERVFATAAERFDGIDIVVNNAGVGGGEGTIEQCPEEIFDRTIAVNLRAVWMGIKLAFPYLRERGGGAIVNTSSISALAGMAGQGAYGASKAGVLQLTRVAAIEGAPHSIRVNAVCPGGTLTPIIYDSPFFDSTIDPAAVESRLADAQPLHRAGLPEDIAGAICWLASGDAAFVTGQHVVVDGGLSIEFDARARSRPQAR